MRKSVASWAFAVVAVLALTFAAACMSGDDDDEESFECDHGQPTTDWGDLYSPMQECFQSNPGNQTDACWTDAYARDEVQWVCKCLPDECANTKADMENLGLDWK